jgi:hypothetical protein
MATLEEKGLKMGQRITADLLKSFMQKQPDLVETNVFEDMFPGLEQHPGVAVLVTSVHMHHLYDLLRDSWGGEPDLVPKSYISFGQGLWRIPSLEQLPKQLKLDPKNVAVSADGVQLAAFRGPRKFVEGSTGPTTKCLLFLGVPGDAATLAPCLAATIASESKLALLNITWQPPAVRRAHTQLCAYRHDWPEGQRRQQLLYE